MTIKNTKVFQSGEIKTSKIKTLSEPALTSYLAGSQKSLVKLATRMRVISRDSMRISICPHYVRIRVTSRNTDLRRRVGVYLCLCETESICLVRRLFLLSPVWLTLLCCG